MKSFVIISLFLLLKVLASPSEDCPFGEPAKEGDSLLLSYVGKIDESSENGTKNSVFDQSDHFKFTLGQGEVIKGWDEELVGKCVGAEFEMVLEPDQAYGESGAGGVIPPNATLNFNVKLLAINDKTTESYQQTANGRSVLVTAFRNGEKVKNGEPSEDASLDDGKEE
eukprot:g144.t1